MFLHKLWLIPWFFVGNGAWPKNSKGMFIPPSLGARGKGRSPGRGTGISIFKYATIVSNSKLAIISKTKRKNRKLEKGEKENDWHGNEKKINKEEGGKARKARGDNAINQVLFTKVQKRKSKVQRDDYKLQSQKYTLNMIKDDVKNKITCHSQLWITWEFKKRS